jgi:hypothetical protein
LDPLLKKIGSDRVNFLSAVTNIAYGERTLHVCGIRLWNALNHEGWRNREAASQAFLDYISQDSLAKYNDLDSKSALLTAAMAIAKKSCNDKVLTVYFNGLKILD